MAFRAPIKVFATTDTIEKIAVPEWLRQGLTAYPEKSQGNNLYDRSCRSD
jgi:hypothetical protein